MSRGLSGMGNNMVEEKCYSLSDIQKPPAKEDISVMALCMRSTHIFMTVIDCNSDRDDELLSVLSPLHECIAH